MVVIRKNEGSNYIVYKCAVKNETVITFWIYIFLIKNDEWVAQRLEWIILWPKVEKTSVFVSNIFGMWWDST